MTSHVFIQPFAGELAMCPRLFVLLTCLLPLLSSGCRKKYREDLDYSYNVQQTWQVEEIRFGEIVQFETVFWEPDDTLSLRKLIVDDAIASNRDVLEIGTGTGLIAILCLQNEADSVVATDINPAAVANARYNAAVLEIDQKLDVRLVPKEAAGAFGVIADDEKFDLIVSNPPWQDGVVAVPADHSFYDPGFALMDSLLDGLPQHLNAGGRCLLAYGHLPAIERLQTEAKKRSFEYKILDERTLDSLDENFLPGMLIEIRVPAINSKVSGGTFTNDATAGDRETDEAETADPATADFEAKSKPQGE